MNIISKLFKRQTANEAYYVRGSSLIRIPNARLNEIPKVIREFHEAQAARYRIS